MIVRNVPEKGTVVLSGDTFLYQNDENDFAEFAEDVEKQKESRRKIICLADFILPGHGQIFQVTPDMKIGAACESGKSMSVRKVGDQLESSNVPKHLETPNVRSIWKRQ